ncbi:MAG: DUF4255 domain-containing protein [Myxococcales bacterium]|nr:DUF4255 domain-containing protein [Myxococcales bacterium]
MLSALDKTLEKFIAVKAPDPSLLRAAKIDFSIPDESFRMGLSDLTLNFFLYEMNENLEARRADPLLERGPDWGAYRRSPALLDCGYCITAWSPADEPPERVKQEHRVLGELVTLLLRYPRIPKEYWEHEPDEAESTAIASRVVAPYPTVVARHDALKNQAEFWTALDHPPKLTLTYVVTIAIPLHDEATKHHLVGPTEDKIQVGVDYQPKAETA